MNLEKIAIAAGELTSRSIRNQAGTRTIDVDPPVEERGLLGNLLNFVTGALRRLGGFIWGLVSWIIPDFSWTALADSLIQFGYTLYQFDHGQADSTLREQIKQNNLALVNQIGRFAGAGAVRFITVGLAGAASLQYPVIAGRVARELAEDASQNLRGEFKSVLQGARTLQTENLMLYTILQLRERRWFGFEPRAQDGPFDSYASRLETQIERIPNEQVRAFARGALEGVEDAVIDVGYVVAMTLDDIAAGNKFTDQQQFGPDRAILIKPNQDIEETVLLTGPQQIVQQSADVILAQHALIENRDVGQIVGIPAEHYERA